MSHVEILNKGVHAWNGWRADNPTISPRLSRVRLRPDLALAGADLRRADLSLARLNGVDLSRADLRGALLSRASLTNAHLSGAHLDAARFFAADLRNADLSETRCRHASFEAARMEGCHLEGARMERSSLRFANLEGARIRHLRAPSELRELIADRQEEFSGTVARRFAWGRLFSLSDGTERPLAICGLSNRVLNELEALGVNTTKELITRSPGELLSRSQLGVSGLFELEAMLAPVAASEDDASTSANP